MGRKEGSDFPTQFYAGLRFQPPQHNLGDLHLISFAKTPILHSAMAERPLTRREAESIESHIAMIKQNAHVLTAEQVDNLTDHMLMAAGYLIAEGHAYVFGASAILDGSDRFVLPIDRDLGRFIGDLGRTLRETSPTAIRFLLERRGLRAQVLPESLNIYEQLRSGHTNPQEITDWLLNIPPSRPPAP